jgi:uncharacterized protein (TIGR00645 family)
LKLSYADAMCAGMNERSVERAVERVIFASRWVLAPMFLGLGVALVVYTARFFLDLWHVIGLSFKAEEADMLLAVLSLVDAALVGSLLAMVIISGYENFVSRLDVEEEARHRISWLGKLDAGSLKVKVASSIVAISSIHLLKAFMNIQHISNEKMFWLVVGHLTFVVSALLMAIIDRISTHAAGAKTGS